MIEIVMTQDEKPWSRLGRFLGLITWNHALLRYPEVGHPFSVRQGLRSPYGIIEAGFGGVVDREWPPEEYTRYAVYRLKEPCSPELYDLMLAFARGEVGKRYAFEWLPPIIIRLLRTFLKNRLPRPGKANVMGVASDMLGKGEVCTSLVDRLEKGGDARE